MAYNFDTNKTYLQTVKLPNDATTYYLNDTEARSAIDAIDQKITGGMHYLGITSTDVKTAPTTQVVSVESTDITAAVGDVVIYGQYEYIWNGTTWQLFGTPNLNDLNGVGAFGYANTGTGSTTPEGTIGFADTAVGDTGNYTPDGDVSIDTTSAVATDSITGITNVGTMPTFSATVNNGELTFAWTDGTTPTADTAKTVVTGITDADISLDFTGKEQTVTFTGTQDTITVTPVQS